MKSSLLLGLGALLMGACLISSCAGSPKKSARCCSSGGASPAAIATPAVQAPASSVDKVMGLTTDTIQSESVRETKPVIGDDSELRR